MTHGKKFSDKTLYTMIGILVIVMLIVMFLSSYKTRESFADPDFTQIGNLVRNKKAEQYVKNGLKYFFASGLDTSIFGASITDEHIRNAVAFAHTPVDSMCLMSGNVEKNMCKMAYIDDLTCPDSSYIPVTDTHIPCTSVSTSLSPSAENCMVRILHNNYRFMKRCFKFPNIISITRQGQTGVFAVTVEGDMTSFLLSRPLFISFGPYGLWAIDHSFSGSKNIFTAYPPDISASATNRLQSVIYIKAIQPIANNNLHMSPFHNSFDITISGSNQMKTPSDISIGNVNTSLFAQLPVTIYYLNYIEPIIYTYEMNGITTTNTLTLILSKSFITANSGAQGALTLSANSGGISLATGVTTNTSLISNIKIGMRSTNAFSVILNSSTEFLSHPLFASQLSTMTQGDTSHDYHIILTISMDMVIIACMVANNSSNNRYSKVYYVKHNITTNTGTPLYLQYNVTGQNIMLSDADTSANANVRKLVLEQKKYNRIINTTAIPNLALIAQQLGYMFFDNHVI